MAGVRFAQVLLRACKLYRTEGKVNASAMSELGGSRTSMYNNNSAKSRGDLLKQKGGVRMADWSTSIGPVAELLRANRWLTACQVRRPLTAGVVFGARSALTSPLIYLLYVVYSCSPISSGPLPPPAPRPPPPAPPLRASLVFWPGSRDHSSRSL